MEIRVTGEVWHWRGPAPYHYVTVPDSESAHIKQIAAGVTYGWGMIPVTATIGETEWTTSLFPKDGRYLIPLKDKVRAAEDIEIGDVVSIHLQIRRD